MRRALAILLPSVLFFAAAPSAHAQEWHESYRDGVKALAQGQAARAVGLLEYAVSKRPQPGRDIVTYGTNVERQYYPYLKLAEAYIKLHDLGGARSALKRSETWAREPAEERRRLAAQVDALAAAAAPPAARRTEPGADGPARDGGRGASARGDARARREDGDAADRRPALTRNSPRSRDPRRRPAARPPRRARPPRMPRGPRPPRERSRAVLEVVSQPPGASVYVDDELIGSTDPEWGRLVRTGLTAGRHRVRLALAGFRDVTEDVDLAAGRTELRRRLVPAEAPGEAPRRAARIAASFSSAAWPSSCWASPSGPSAVPRPRSRPPSRSRWRAAARPRRRRDEAVPSTPRPPRPRA